MYTERRRVVAMISETIIGRYDTTFGKIIVVSTDKVYKVGDTIETDKGEFRIRKVIPQTRPAERSQFSFVVD